MRIALIGYGKMGREIEAVLQQQGDEIAERFNSSALPSVEALSQVDVCLEFSRPESAVENIRTAIAAGTDIVVGTTGWYQHLPELRLSVVNSGLLYASNFSLGMNIFQRIVAAAAELVDRVPDYDPFIHEIHHRQKADSPSGTAMTLAGILTQKIRRKTSIQSGERQGRIKPEALDVSSSRAGTVTGTHLVAFDSEADLIELRHIAKNRRGFALGAVLAAKWLHGRKGVYTMDDVEL